MILPTPPESDAFAQHREEERAGSGNVLIGYGTSGEDGPRRRRRRAVETVNSPAAKVISPVVRKLARDNGVDLEQLSGSGAGGVITRGDVELAISATPPAVTRMSTGFLSPGSGRPSRTS